jgi:cysteine-S-conjugate beta-lyase
MQYKEDTKVVRVGRDSDLYGGIVNPPVYHASTVLFPTVEEFETSQQRKYPRMRYGLLGTPTTSCLEQAIAELEGGYGTVLCSSGLAAISIALMAFVKSGENILMVDSVYGPTRRFCYNCLPRYGVTTTFYDPQIGAGISDLIKEKTSLIFIESPGSLTFEVQDVIAISLAAKEKGAIVLMDNTWASPILFKPFTKGVDVSIQAATKYIAGHSDVMLGAVTATEEAWPRVKACFTDYGQQGAPDDVYLAQRGLRTISIRLKRHEETGLILANWLKDRPEVERVLHPAFSDCPGHEFWKRDFLGATGLFGVVLKPAPRHALFAMLDHMELFGIGFSWGGYESLIAPYDLSGIRTILKYEWDKNCVLLRINTGLENQQDLIADLDAGFDRLKATN